MILWFVTVHQTRPVVSEPWPGGEHGWGREAATARGETPGGQREERPTEMSAGPAAVRGRVRSAVLSCDSAGVCVTVTHKVGQIQTSRCFILNVRTICTSFHYVKHTYCTCFINSIVTPSLKKNFIGVLRICEKARGIEIHMYIVLRFWHMLNKLLRLETRY